MKDEGLIAIIEDEGATNAGEDAVNEHMLRDQVLQAVYILTDREKQVIALRFGVVIGECGENGIDHTLEEIGRIMVTTRERVRQVEAKALRKLRHPTRTLRLRQLL